MAKKLTEKEFQAIIQPLPAKVRGKMKRDSFNEAILREEIAIAKQNMKNDITFGIPWFLMYVSSLYIFGLTPATIALLIIGMGYFVYSFIKRGSYGLNRKKVQVYEKLLPFFGKGKS